MSVKDWVELVGTLAALGAAVFAWLQARLAKESAQRAEQSANQIVASGGGPVAQITAQSGSTINLQQSGGSGTPPTPASQNPPDQSA